MTGIEFWLPAAFILTIGVAYHTLPMLRKRNLYFGVTVDPGFRDSAGGRSVAVRYWLILWSFCVAATILLGLFHWPLTPLVAVAGGFVAWVAAWSKTRPHAVAQTVRSAPLIADASEGFPGGWLALIVPIVIQIVNFCIVISRYDDLPDRLPVHWGIAGTPDRWVAKSWGSVTGSAVAGLTVTMILLGAAWMILRQAKRGSGGETGDFGARHRRGNVTMLVAVAWALTVVFCCVAQLPLHPGIPVNRMLLVFLLPLVIIAIKGVQLYRMSAKPTGGSDGTPEECWKYGAFYYNPADPALVVEKRTGPGFTLNFGNRMSWVLLLVLAVAILAPALARR